MLRPQVRSSARTIPEQRSLKNSAQVKPTIAVWPQDPPPLTGQPSTWRRGPITGMTALPGLANALRAMSATISFGNSPAAESCFDELQRATAWTIT